MIVNESATYLLQQLYVTWTVIVGTAIGINKAFVSKAVKAQQRQAAQEYLQTCRLTLYLACLCQHILIAGR